MNEENASLHEEGEPSEPGRDEPAASLKSKYLDKLRDKVKGSGAKKDDKRSLPGNRDHGLTRKAKARKNRINYYYRDVEKSRAMGNKLKASRRGTYYHLKWAWENQKGTEWHISLDEWNALWDFVPDILLSGGKEVSAFSLRGRSYSKSVKLGRLDTSKPWSIENVLVLYRGDIIARGSDMLNG